METLKFKTNINCAGCIKAVTPHMDKNTGIKHWEVNTADPAKILTVDAEGISSEEVEQLVKKAGFEISPL